MIPVFKTVTVRTIDNEQTGRAARTLRLNSRIPVTVMARRMDMRAGQLVNMEMGRRPWTEQSAARYCRVVQKIVEARAKPAPRRLR